MSSSNIDDLPPPLAGAAAAAAPTHATLASLQHSMQQMQAAQVHQTDLLQRLNETVLTSRAMINDLVVQNNALREDIRAIKDAGGVGKQTAAASSTMLAAATRPPGLSNDEEIDALIETRRWREAWPVKLKTLDCFNSQPDLVKLRFHRSEKHQHIPVRIPKTEKNKDGTKPCKLCSEGKIRRKTTWMCSTCEVPLCTRPLLDEEGASLSHHARWHVAQDLKADHDRIHAILKNGRESRKRARNEVEDGDEALKEEADNAAV